MSRLVARVVLVPILAVLVTASTAVAQIAMPMRRATPAHGIMLPTIPTLRTIDGRLELVPGVPLETWPTARSAPVRGRVLQADEAARANARAVRACPIPTITGDTSARMPRVPHAHEGATPIPVAAVRCIAHVA